MIYDAAVEILKQLTFVAALLCGFSLTYFVGLLQLKLQGKISVICLLSVCVATCFLLLSTLAGSSGIYWLSERPGLVETTETIQTREYLIAYRWSIYNLLLGMITLLNAIALSGYLKSKKVGILTSLFGYSTLIFIFLFLGMIGID